MSITAFTEQQSNDDPGQQKEHITIERTEINGWEERNKVNISIYYDQPHRKPIIKPKQTIITNKRIEQVARCKLTYKNQQCFSISAIILEIKAENSNKTKCSASNL